MRMQSSQASGAIASIPHLAVHAFLRQREGYRHVCTSHLQHNAALQIWKTLLGAWALAMNQSWPGIPANFCGP
jgi:hypothetical protein